MRRAVEARLAAVRSHVAAHVATVRGVAAEETPHGVRVRGRHLHVRWLTTARLRDLGRWL